MDLMSRTGDVEEVLQRYRQDGARGSFVARPAGMIECRTCGTEEHAGDADLLGLDRIDDPAAGEVVVAGLACASCGTRGTLVVQDNPTSSDDDGFVLAELAGR